MSLIEENSSVILPIMFASLYRISKEHWNPWVQCHVVNKTHCHFCPCWNRKHPVYYFYLKRIFSVTLCSHTTSCRPSRIICSSRCVFSFFFCASSTNWTVFVYCEQQRAASLCCREENLVECERNNSRWKSVKRNSHRTTVRKLWYIFQLNGQSGVLEVKQTHSIHNKYFYEFIILLSWCCSSCSAPTSWS